MHSRQDAYHPTDSSCWGVCLKNMLVPTHLRWVWAWMTPRCGLGDPLDVGLETPLARPLNFPLRKCVFWKPARYAEGIPSPPWRPAARHAGVHYCNGMLGYHHFTHPPMNRITDTCNRT